MSLYATPQVCDIVVSGGVGSSVIKLGGTCIAIGVKPPTAVSVYDVEVVDNDGFGLAGEAQCTGICKIDEQVQFFGNHTVSISNATVDGTYRVKLRSWDPGWWNWWKRRNWMCHL